MKTFPSLFALLIFSFLIISCQPSIDLEQEKAKILKLRSDIENAAIKNDIDTILSFCVERYVVYEGKVEKTTHEDIRNDFEKDPPPESLEIEDIFGPIINISNSGDMAYAIGERRFLFSPNDSTEKVTISEFSYIQIFEKVNDEWKYSHMARTNLKRE